MKKLGEDLWTASQSFKVMGTDLGTRMTVMRVGDELVLHSPIRIDEELAQEIDVLGTVKWLVAPCAFHHLFVKRAKGRWPDAKVLAVPGISEKQPGLAIDAVFPEIESPWGDAIETRFIDGMPRLNEVALFHRASKTLVLTDFIFNIPKLDGFFGPTMLKMFGSYGGPRQSKIFRMLMNDREQVREARNAMLDWDFDKITVTHREPIEENGKEIFTKITSWI